MTQKHHKISGTKLERIRTRAIKEKDTVFNNLLHAIDMDLLRECFLSLSENKAEGIDGVTKDNYREKLNENLTDLHNRVRSNEYKPKPARIVEIPKADGTTRPLAIGCLEDKIVQEAIKRILEAIYEPRFIDSSHGFRPGKGCDTALVDVNKNLMKSNCEAVVDIDLRKFFDSIPHDKLVLILEMKISQPSFIRLIIKILRTPKINQDGKIIPNTQGVPQGSIVSPLLANIYLHYVLDCWFLAKVNNGELSHATIVRYADDAIFTFDSIAKAKGFAEMLKTRLDRAGIELNEAKTKITPFGRNYAIFCERNGVKKPTFTFLGFTHYWKKRIGLFGPFWRPAVKGCSKRMNKKINLIAKYIRENRHKPNLIELVARTVRGVVGYFYVNGNAKQVQSFNHAIQKLLKKWLNRRGQKGLLTWAEFIVKIKREGYPMSFKVKNLFYVMKPALRAV